MAADIIVLRPAGVRLRADVADRVKGQLELFRDDLGDDLLGDIHYRLDRATSPSGRWTFVMLSPEQNRAVVQFILTTSERPMQAVALWTECFVHLDHNTGEIRLTRAGLAKAAGLPVSTVSAVMSELRKFDAISTRRQKIDGVRGPGLVRYFMNPNVATHLKGKARDLAQEAAPQLALPEPVHFRQFRPEVVT